MKPVSSEDCSSILLVNRQRTQPLDLPLLRELTHHFLECRLRLKEFDLTINLVNTKEMARLNESILGHEGSTDVITLDYADDVAKTNRLLTGELFVCVDEAMIQARRFKATWQTELVRYIVHGVLHLLGYDDLNPAARRRMKREEAKRLGELARDFPLSKLRRKPKVQS